MAAAAKLVTLIPIRDMTRALRFYTKTLGGRMTDRAPGKMRNMWASVRLAGADIWLIEPERFERRTLAYSTLVVKNIRSSVRALTKKGVKFQRAERMGPDSRIEGPIVSDSVGAAAFFKDPEGNLLMLFQTKWAN